MKIFYYLLYFLCYMAFILPTTCTLVSSDGCSQRKGECKRNCLDDEKQIDICLSPRMICCTETVI
ncbi:beta-defensin 114 [Nannospalax galili]|uniref:beta-defensin 114 n=1 Tax=Nannospalax galili TaxID=1026970 RepID=UPI00081A055D|nr:beta-defensin 114 [Nannospalax galili]